MEQTVLERLNGILDDSGKTKRCFANEIDMNATTVWRQLKGEQAVSLTLIQGFLSAFPEVSAEWLLRGEGEREKSSSVSSSPKPYELPDEGKPLMAADEIHVTGNVEAELWKIRYEELEKRYDQLIGVLGKGGV